MSALDHRDLRYRNVREVVENPATLSHTLFAIRFPPSLVGMRFNEQFNAVLDVYPCHAGKCSENLSDRGRPRYQSPVRQ